ncbi:MAG: arginine--tRNA ligase [Candidatus Latescibacteria bacterium]|nr:arginine--tRNA ligase [Candidatus Latescibacterota bacterium]
MPRLYFQVLFLRHIMSNPFIHHISEQISAASGLPAGEIAEKIEVPPDPNLGDYAFPCFSLAKRLKKAPPLIAKELAEKVQPGDLFAEIRPVGPYLNFFADRRALVRHILGGVLAQGASYGEGDEGTGKTVVIDYSSPNIAKEFHVGHLITTVMGNALLRLHEARGYRVVGINHLGDWGTPIGMVIVAFKRWGDRLKVETSPIDELLKLYIRFREEEEKDPSLRDEARAWVKKLEEDDEEALALWRWFREESIREYVRIYDLLGVRFDEYSGESAYTKQVDGVVARLLDMGLAVPSEGALVVMLDAYDMPPCILKRSDGASIYASRDICAALSRYEKYRFDRMLYVTDVRQSLHFRQFFKVLELMCVPWAPHLEHVAYGLLSFKGEAMATRSGNIVLLKDVLGRAIDLTRKIIAEKNPDLPDREAVAQEVGIGAVIFATLSGRRIKDSVFDWDEILNFNGETGPYVQYTHARYCSVLRKYGHAVPPPDADLGLLASDEAVAVLKRLEQFPQKVRTAAETCEPSLIATFLLDLCAVANQFYNVHRVISEDAALTKARIALVYSIQVILEKGLKLLGMKAPEGM